MCMFDDAETVTLLSERTRSAAKTHRCGECRRVIERGEEYLVDSFVHDGEFESHKTCAHCKAVRQWLEHECGGFVYGGVLEDLHDHADDYRRFDLYRLVVGMRRQWETRSGSLMRVPAVPATSMERAAA